MILYRLIEKNADYTEVVGIFQDAEIAKRAVQIMPKKEYQCLYVIDMYNILDAPNIIDPLICPL